MVTAIETAMAGIDDAVMRLGIGIRLFFKRAQRDPVWCRFVARVWNVGGLDLPVRDFDTAIRQGHFRVPGREAAYGVLFGGIREALRRIGEGHVPAGYGDQVAEICLRALQADPRRIAAVLAHELPEMARSALGRRP